MGCFRVGFFGLKMENANIRGNIYGRTSEKILGLWKLHPLIEIQQNVDAQMKKNTNCNELWAWGTEVSCKSILVQAI